MSLPATVAGFIAVVLIPTRYDPVVAPALILVGTKDLLNPEFEPKEAARFIRDVRVMTISPGTVTGHAAAGGAFPADVEFLNRQSAEFLDVVTNRGKTLQ